MKLFYVTKRTFVPDEGLKFSEPSQTLQGEVRSLQELIKRAMEGYPIPTKNVFYFDQEQIDMINRYQAPHSLDLTDLDALDNHIQLLQMKVDDAKRQLDEERNKKPDVEPDKKNEPNKE